jgi:hypothetical protein
MFPTRVVVAVADVDEAGFVVEHGGFGHGVR